MQQNRFSNSSIYDTLELTKAYCLNLTGIDLQGGNMNVIFHSIQLQFMMCENERGCATEEETERYFEMANPTALIYFLDTVYDLQNKKSRVEKYINYIDVNVTYYNSKMTNIYFAKNELVIHSDNFFSTSQTKYCNFMIDSNRDYVSSRGKNRYEFLLVNLLSSKKEQIINIHYMSLMDLFANVGSISNIIMILFTTLGNYTNHYFFQNDLIKVFSHEEQKVGRFLFINKSNNKDKEFHRHLRTKPTSDIDHGQSLNVTNTPILIKDKVTTKQIHKMCFSQKQVFLLVCITLYLISVVVRYVKAN